MQKKKRRKKNQKQIKGFTLIELLAVITILGILMLVAIPNITRTIENSRKDTFADVAKSYINALKNEMAANAIKCSHDGTTWNYMSELSDGRYYFYINTIEDGDWYQQTRNLMESGGKSSWGNSDLQGYIFINREKVDGNVVTTYSIRIADFAGHGIGSDYYDYDGVEESQLKRNVVETSGADPDDIMVGEDEAFEGLVDEYMCILE